MEERGRWRREGGERGGYSTLKCHVKYIYLSRVCLLLATDGTAYQDQSQNSSITNRKK